MNQLLTCTLLLLLSTAQEESIDGIPYRRLADRASTERSFLEALGQVHVDWGSFHEASPFPFSGTNDGDIRTPHAPEEQLKLMQPGAAGPDLGLVYSGKGDTEVTWTEIGPGVDVLVDFKHHEDEALNDNSIAYLYGTFTAPGDRSFTLSLGSDDGLMIWLNGALIHERDVMRGLDPASDRVTFDAQEGVNHVLFKVSQGVGGWQLYVNTKRPLEARQDTALQYFLARDFPATPAGEFYLPLTLPTPDDVVLEVGGLDFLPDGRPIVCTRRGEVWIVDGAYEIPPLEASYHLFASGLHEPLGLEVRSPGKDGNPFDVYCVQRAELTRLVDLDGDLVCDVYESFCDDWGVSGNYHEFAFGPRFDNDGNAWVTLNVGFCGALGKAVVPWRGWAVKISPDGELTPVCDGLRSPNGLGMNRAGDMFYVDNQGDWVGTCALRELREGAWHGHPAGLRWRDGWEAGDPFPELFPTAVWLPYKKMGQSTADVMLCDVDGAFGPFDGQLLVGDQMTAEVLRISLEKVDGIYQGMCAPLIGGLDSGLNRLAFAPDGSLFVGQTDRGWGSIGRKRFGLQRIIFRGGEPFEILTAKTLPDGFEFEFTSDLDPAQDLTGVLNVQAYTYEHHAPYGSPEMDKAPREVTAIERIDARRLRVRLSRMTTGYVHELDYKGLLDATGRHPIEGRAYVTVQRVPRSD